MRHEPDPSVPLRSRAAAPAARSGCIAADVAGYPETAVTTRPIAKPTPALMEPTTIT